MPLMKFMLVVSLAFAMEACADPYYTAAPIEAWVVDADTGAPIEGAVVTANWQLVGFSYDTGGRKLGQLAVMETVTDRNGRFSFPGFTKVNISGNVLREEDPQILIFKSGYRYLRAANEYPIGKEGEQGSYRKSSIIGQRLKMKKADEDIKKYAFILGVLGGYLSVITDGEVPSPIPQMIHVLACERQRVRALDPSVGSISVPGAVPPEENCGSNQ
jgi:hypothetical protein